MNAATAEVPGDVRALHAPPGSPGLARRWPSSSSPQRRACAPRTTPPTAAISSTTEVISKASRWSVRNRRPISAGLPKLPQMRRRVRELAARLEPDRDEHLDEDRRRRGDRRDAVHARPAGPGRVGAAAEVGDHEQEHDHHRARVDEHLRGGDELGREQQVEHGQRGEVADQRQRRVERVREADDGDPRADAGERGAEPDDPGEHVAGVRCEDERRSRVRACSRGSACRTPPGRRPGPS